VRDKDISVLLTQFGDGSSALFTNESDSKTDIAGFAELLNDGYINGVPAHDEIGRVTQIANMTITVTGRALLDEQKAQGIA